MLLGPILQSRRHLEECHSTNDALWSMLDEESSHSEQTGLYVTTSYQQSGRGHGSSVWHSSPGLNILISIHACPEIIQPIFQFDISRIISLNLLDFCTRAFGTMHQFSVKWPNDLYAGAKKLGGILIENRVMGQKIAGTVIGIGLNINETNFPVNVPNPTSIKLLTGSTQEIDKITDQLIAALRANHRKILKYEPQQLQRQYDAVLMGLGKKMRYKAGNRVFEGVILGTDRAGLLRMQTDTGERYFGFKEIALMVE
jgi:BirA family transcriptional regulator, biotin operon repressor / biotin---[acetyl-CoA-carboxylase] ligase